MASISSTFNVPNEGNYLAMMFEMWWAHRDIRHRPRIAMDATQCGRTEVVREGETHAVSHVVFLVTRGSPCAPDLVPPSDAALACRPRHRQERHLLLINMVGAVKPLRTDAMHAHPHRHRLPAMKGRLVQFNQFTPEDRARTLPTASTEMVIDHPYIWARHTTRHG